MPLPEAISNALAQLLGSAQARPDLGQQQPVATYAGRMVRPGESPAQILARPATDSPDAEGLGGLGAGLAGAYGAYKNAASAAGIPSMRIPKFNETRAMQWNPQALDFQAVHVPMPSGEYATPAETILQSLGQPGQKLDQLRSMLNGLREKSSDIFGVAPKKAPTLPPGYSQRGAELARTPFKMPETPVEKMLAAAINEPTGEVMYLMRPYRAGDHGGLMTIAETLNGWKPTRGFVDPQTFDAYTEAMLEEALMRKKGILP